MKMTKVSIALMAGCLLALTPSVQAQTEKPATNAAPANPRGRMMSVDAQLDRLAKELTLTDEQKPKVKAVLEEENTKRQEIMSGDQAERRTKFQALRDETSKKLKAILTPEQFTKYEAMPRGRGQGRRNQGGQTNNPAGGQ